MICADTSFIIDFLKGNNEAIKMMEKNKEDIVTTEINVFEVFIGIYTKENYEKEEELAKNFFNSINIIKISGWGIKSAQILASLIRKGNIIEENDSHIVSIMLTNGCNKIITRNKKHFSRIKDIEVIDY